MKYAIQVEGLKKNYGAHAALKGVTFDVLKGEIFALLGVNGAGKTTALECIEGLRKYDEGRVSLHGKAGIQLQSASLPAHIRAMEAVRLFAAWNRTKPDDSLLAGLGIDELAKKQYASLSTGQKRRLHLALALTGAPEIVFLDEPTAGLDVEGRIALHAQIRKLKERGKTIVLASHDMAEVENLSDRLAILREGLVVFTGSAEELTQKFGRRHTIRIKTERGEERFDSDNIGETLAELLAGYKREGLTVLDVQTDRGTLEEHFIHLSRGTNA